MPRSYIRSGLLVFFFIVMTFVGLGQNRIISTYAGPTLPVDGALATSQAIDEPSAVVSDGKGGFYVASINQNRVYRVAEDGKLSLIAGSGRPGYDGDGGQATAARLLRPSGLALDSDGNLYVVDLWNGYIRKVTPEGIISTVAKVGSMRGVAADSSGNLYATAGNRVFKITPDGAISTVAGTTTMGFSGDGGPATAANLATPWGIAVDTAGNIYFADANNDRIRVVNPEGVINTIAGGGYGGDGDIATSAQLADPKGIALDASGNLYIADSMHDRVRKVTPAGIISTVAGNGSNGSSGDGGQATLAMFNDPSCVAVDAYGNLYIADRWNNRVRKVTPAGIISTVAGNGTSGFEGDGSQASFARFHDPKDAAIDSSGSLYISDSTNNRIRKITPGGMVSTVAGTGTEGFSGDGGPATLAMLNNPFGLALDSEDNLYIADFYNSRVRKVTPAGIISTVAGNGTAGFGGDGGPAVSANISYPYNIAVDAAGSLYIADAGNNRIRKVDSAGIITTVAGNGTSGFSGDGSQAASAQLKSPEDVAVDGAGNLYIADRGNSRIRKVTPDGVISTLSLASPTGLTVDATGNVYTLDWTVSNLRKVTPAGVWSWILGSPSGIQGFSGDGGLTSAAQVYSPRGITVDAAGNLYIADTWNQRIRKARIPRSTWDTDADGKNDVTVWRPESGVWYVLPTGTPGTYSGTQWGMTGDLPVPGDYDGDGKTDYSVWRPDSGTWYALSSGTPESYSSTQWGQSTDNPVPGDYDGDLITDLAVWRPGSGVWYILLSGTPGSYTSTQWGLPTDVPVPGDYDGDGKVDLAVWRPSSGIWYILSSRYPGSYRSITWGLSTDIPVPGDFDSDSKTDVAVWRPGSGTWYILPSTTPGHHTATQWGLSADTPVIGDFDNDGKADIAVWRQSSGTWYILLSTNPGSYIATQWGRSGDQPISGATLIIGLLSRQIP